MGTENGPIFKCKSTFKPAFLRRKNIRRSFYKNRSIGNRFKKMPFKKRLLNRKIARKLNRRRYLFNKFMNGRFRRKRFAPKPKKSITIGGGLMRMFESFGLKKN